MPVGSFPAPSLARALGGADRRKSLLLRLRQRASEQVAAASTARAPTPRSFRRGWSTQASSRVLEAQRHRPPAAPLCGGARWWYSPLRRHALRRSARGCDRSTCLRLIIRRDRAQVRRLERRGSRERGAALAHWRVGAQHPVVRARSRWCQRLCTRIAVSQMRRIATVDSAREASDTDGKRFSHVALAVGRLALGHRPDGGDRGLHGPPSPERCRRRTKLKSTSADLQAPQRRRGQVAGFGRTCRFRPATCRRSRPRPRRRSRTVR